MSGKKQKIIFKDQICNAKLRKKSMSMKCQKGTLKFSGDNVADFWDNIANFWLYRTWCNGCDRIVDQQDFHKQFRRFLRTVKKMIKNERDES